MERDYSYRLCCSKEVHDLIVINCINEFIEHHPEFHDMKISHNFILRKIAEYYIKGD